MSRGRGFPGCQQTPRACVSKSGQKKAASACLRGATFVCISYLSNRVLDHLLVRHIALVAHEKLVDTFGGIAVNLLEPLLHVVEAVHVGDIVDDANAVGATIVGRGDGSEALLASGVPLVEARR